MGGQGEVEGERPGLHMNGQLREAGMLQDLQDCLLCDGLWGAGRQGEVEGERAGLHMNRQLREAGVLQDMQDCLL